MDKRGGMNEQEILNHHIFFIYLCLNRNVLVERDLMFLEWFNLGLASFRNVYERLRRFTFHPKCSKESPLKLFRWQPHCLFTRIKFSRWEEEKRIFNSRIRVKISTRDRSYIISTLSEIPRTVSVTQSHLDRLRPHWVYLANLSTGTQRSAIFGRSALSCT